MKAEDKNTVVFSFSAEHQPVAQIKPDEVLVVETADCFNGQLHDEDQDPGCLDMSQLNPVTGPFYVLGAEAGDALEVEILEIKPGPRGIMLAGPGIGETGRLLDKLEHRLVRISGNSILFAEGISLPYQPMVGVIGVAPAEGSAPTTIPGSHGGNLDTREIRVGSKVLLPVYQPGALVALGDLHALMGDGELCGTGVEMAGEVKIRVSLYKNRQLEGPQVSFDQGVALLRSAETLAEAIRQVTDAAVRYIEEEAGLPTLEACMFASAACQLRISQIVNPLVTAKIIIPDISKIIAN